MFDPREAYLKALFQITKSQIEAELINSLLIEDISRNSTTTVPEQDRLPAIQELLPVIREPLNPIVKCVSSAFTHPYLAEEEVSNILKRASLPPCVSPVQQLPQEERRRSLGELITTQLRSPTRWRGLLLVGIAWFLLTVWLAWTRRKEPCRIEVVGYLPPFLSSQNLL
eukprot:sb/3472319/